VEWLWHVSEGDEPIGRVERGKAHEKMAMHRAGIVFLVDKQNRVYVTRRAASKKIFPKCYDASSSFHVSYGEGYDEAARREAMEELGLSKPLTKIGKFSHYDVPESQFVAVFVMDYDGEKIRLDPKEASGGRFHQLEEVGRIVREELVTPWLRDGFLILDGWARSRGAGD
jgi:isopentenyldiphosphate isomerase